MSRFRTISVSTIVLILQTVLAAPAAAQLWEYVNVGGLDIGTYTDVWGSSENDVFITGSSGILHYDGNGWSEMTLPAGISCCSSIWGISGSDVYATGNGVLLHYNGGSWSEVDIGASQTLLESTDLFDVWAGRGGGQDRVVVLGSQGRVFTKTGSTWSAGGTSIYPNVAVRGDSNTYTRTYWYPSVYLGDPYYYRTWHFNGTSWSVQDRSQQAGAVFHYGWGSAIGTPSESVVGVGNNVAARYDSTGAATIMTSPVSGDSFFSFKDITGTPGAIFAVGNDGFNGKLLKADGTVWSDVTPTGLTDFRDVWGAHLKDLWVLTPHDIRHWGYPVSATDLRLTADVIQTVVQPSKFTQGKPIYVRAFLNCANCSGTQSGNGTMTLDFDGFSQQIDKEIVLIPGEDLDSLRGQPGASFNFRIPASEFELSSGSVEKTIELSLDATLGGQHITKSWSKTITIEYVEPLTIGIAWIHLLSGGLVHSPTLRDEELAVQHMREVYPGEIDIRFLGSVQFDVDAVGGVATCDDGCLSKKVLDDVGEIFVKGLLASELFKGVDYVHGLIPFVPTDIRLDIGGMSDPYWHSSEALGYNSMGPRMFMSHEVGHNIGLKHPAWIPPPSPSSPTWMAGVCPNNGATMLRSIPGVEEYNYEWPFTDPYIHTWGWGAEPKELKAEDVVYDFMSYCGDGVADTVPATEEWISAIHYERLLSKIEAPPHSLKASPSDASLRIGLLPEDRAILRIKALQSVFAVEIVLNSDDTVDLIRAEKVTGDVTFPRAPTSGGPTDYCVSTEDSGAPLDTQCYDVAFVNDDFEPLDQVSFLSFLQFNASATSIAVRKNGALLDSIQRSATIPTISSISVTPTVTESMYTVCWTVTDGDGEGITASVFYSPDSGTSWLPVAVDQGGSCATATLAGLPASDSGLIRVVVNDGFNTSSADAVTTVTVEDIGPTVYLAHGEEVRNLRFGEPFQLAATAFDAEDGELPKASIVWKDALGTTIGTGGVIVTVTKGVQTYTVSATDLDGNVTTRSVRLALEPGPPLFADGFESGNTSEWSGTVN